jgi:hypothetical protein
MVSHLLVETPVVNAKITSVVPPSKIVSLDQLDALVGRYVMDDRPNIYWEHTYSHWRFESLGDALEALNDPFFASLVPEGKRASLSVAEVREYPAYSSDVTMAMRVVERLGEERKPLNLASLGQKWTAAFGTDDRVDAPSSSAAICMAALRSRGIEVELARQMSTGPVPASSAIAVSTSVAA